MDKGRSAISVSDDGLRVRLWTFQFAYGFFACSATAWANAGFVLHEPGSDHVRCRSCGLQMQCLFPLHDPLMWHRILSADCPFIRQMEGGTQSVQRARSPSLEVYYRLPECNLPEIQSWKAEKHRENSFEKCLHESIFRRKKDLAKSGFYVDPKVENSLCCAFCPAVLRFDEVEKNIRPIHELRSPTCPLITFVECGNIPDMGNFLGELTDISGNIGSNIPAFQDEEVHRPGQLPPQADRDANVVQQALELYPRDQVIAAVHHMLQNHGNVESVAKIASVITMMAQPNNNSFSTQPPVVARLPNVDVANLDISRTCQEDILEVTVPKEHVELANKVRTLKAYSMELTCAVCHHGEAAFFFLPCGHLVTCVNCRDQPTCKVCRGTVRGSVNVTSRPTAAMEA